MRGNRWYTRIQVPKYMQERLQKKEHWVSLGTPDKAEALRVATVVTARKRTEISDTFHRLENITFSLSKLSDDFQLSLRSAAFKGYLMSENDLIDEFNASQHSEVSKFLQFREEVIQQTLHKLRANDFEERSIRIVLLKLSGEFGFRIPDHTPAYRQALRIVGEAFIEARRHEMAVLRGWVVHEAPDKRIINPETGALVDVPTPRQVLSQPLPPKVSLTNLVKDFVGDPNKVRTEKTKSTMLGYLNVVVEIIGDDTDLSSITEEDCIRVRDTLLKLPPNFKKLPDLMNRPVLEMVSIANRKGMQTLSPTGVNNYLKNLFAFLKWCERRGKLDRLPTVMSEIQVADPVRKEDKRLPFNDQQLTQIYSQEAYAANQRDSCMFWVPLIALWNGMRSNEICQLDSADVKLIDDVWGFDITHISSSGGDDKKLKTGASIRFIPIHPKLIDFGLLDFHARRKASTKLFGDISIGKDGYYSSTFSKRSNRYLKRIGVHGPKHVFHSLRHNFKVSDVSAYGSK